MRWLLASRDFSMRDLKEMFEFPHSCILLRQNPILITSIMRSSISPNNTNPSNIITTTMLPSTITQMLLTTLTMHNNITRITTTAMVTLNHSSSLRCT